MHETMVGELHGKIALVTGAATGIGRASALALARDGADVIVHYSRSKDDAANVVDQVKALGRRAHAIQGDFKERADVARVATQAEAHWGRVDVLVNCAAIIEHAIDVRTEDGDFSKHMGMWDAVLDVNLRAPVELTWRLARGMKERKTGSVVNVASVAGHYALTDAPLYSLSKAALMHFTRQAALTYAPFVRVNAVAPGWTETSFNEGRIMDPGFQKAVSRHIPMRRLATPDEIADAVLYLAKGGAYVTGTTLNVDGGLVTELR